MSHLPKLRSRVLIVDDSVTVRRLLDQVLNKSGYQVVQCRDGKEVVEALNQPGDLYNAVISDIEMPRMDGFSLLREIRSSKNLQNLPVAMLTSRENDTVKKLKIWEQMLTLLSLLYQKNC